MPNAFQDRKEHRYFGYSSSLKDDCWGRIGVLTAFWQAAAKGEHTLIFENEGRRVNDSFVAPIACYAHRGKSSDETGYLLLQQGSYQLIPFADQPLMSQGELCIYRGIGQEKTFNLLTASDVDPDDPVLSKYFTAIEKTFSDSEIAFQVAHSFVKRCETGFLADRLSWHDVAQSCGLSTEGCGPDEALVNFHCDSFTLSRHLALVKFGPSIAGFTTPATNVRITSLFAGEYEVNVIDPRKLSPLETQGCTLRPIPLGSR